MSTKLDSRVSFILDDFILDKDKAFWFVTLSDGSIVYQDDERYGIEDRAWIRLKNYCHKSKLSIESVSIRFRSHTEKVLDNTGDGIFYKRKVLGSPVDKTRHYYLFGVVKDTRIAVQHWIIPEVIHEEDDDRELENHEETVIWNPTALQKLKKNTSQGLRGKKQNQVNS